jgi:hypothetical protein
VPMFAKIRRRRMDGRPISSAQASSAAASPESSSARRNADTKAQ